MHGAKLSWLWVGPFDSPAVREIAVHMTGAERMGAVFLALLYGFWVGVTFAHPISKYVADPDPANLLLALPLVALFAAGVPIVLWVRRRYLASTGWAKEQGIRPEDLKLFSRRV